MRLDLLSLPDGELGAVTIIARMLATEQLAMAWGLPEITNWQNEFRFPKGIADFVLFHRDGTVSIVEVKDAGCDRDILAGIGQLSLYAMQAGWGLRGQRVRRILTAPVAAAASQHLADACRLAGVQFEPLGPLAEHRAAIAALFCLLPA